MAQTIKCLVNYKELLGRGGVAGNEVFDLQMQLTLPAFLPSTPAGIRTELSRGRPGAVCLHSGETCRAGIHSATESPRRSISLDSQTILLFTHQKGAIWKAGHARSSTLQTLQICRQKEPAASRDGQGARGICSSSFPSVVLQRNTAARDIPA